MNVQQNDVILCIVAVVKCIVSFARFYCETLRSLCPEKTRASRGHVIGTVWVQFRAFTLVVFVYFWMLCYNDKIGLGHRGLSPHPSVWSRHVMTFMGHWWGHNNRNLFYHYHYHYYSFIRGMISFDHVRYLLTFQVRTVMFLDSGAFYRVSTGLWMFHSSKVLGPLLLTWFNFNPSMDK